MTKNIILLFLSFLKIGLLSIGGGYATIPLIQEEVVNIHNWITTQEFTDIITISQMTPGPLAVNTSTFVGIQIAGITGALVATIGCIFFGFIISIILYSFFSKHKNNKSITNILKTLRASSIGLIASSAATILILAFYSSSKINIIAIFIFSISLFLLRKFKNNPMTIIVLTGALGLIFYLK